MNVPKLRFSEFEGEWEEKQLSHYMTFKNGVNADKSMYGHGRKFINVMDIIAERPIVSENIIGSVSISDAEFKKNEVAYGDILFQRSSETREETGQSNVYLDQERSATFGGFVIRGRPVVDLDPRYFDALLKTDKARKDITNRSGGSTRFNVGQASLGAVVVDVAPTLPEQKKIAAFLGVVDAKIAALRARRDGLERYKRGLMQALFSQTLRFTKPDGTAFSDWSYCKLGDLLFEVSEKSTSQDEHVILSSTKKGVFVQSDYFNGNVASKDNIGYKTLRPGQIVLSPQNLWLGNINLYEDGPVGLVSPSYKIFNCVDDKVHVKFISYLIHQPRMVFEYGNASEQGASVVRRNLNLELFNAIPVNLPHPDEQQKIVDALSTIDAKIAAVADQVRHMETFKKGLLQQMFV